MSGRLEGKTVMVTGAGTGFGAELAVKAADEGAGRVIVHYRSSKAGAEGTARRIEAARAAAHLVQGDISSWDDIKRMVSEAGDLDVLVNNVGDMASEQTSWDQLTEATIDHVLAIDIKGTMLMVHEFGGAMKARGRGALPRHRRCVPHHRQLHDLRRRLQHAGRLSRLPPPGPAD